MKYIWACFPRQLLVLANRILKQLSIPEYYMGVYHKGGSNANGRTSILDASHDYVKKVVPERSLILILTSYRTQEPLSG